MLKVIKQTIDELPSESFGEFYQDYVANLEDDILDHDMKIADSAFKSIDDIPEIIKGLNKMTQELK